MSGTKAGGQQASLTNKARFGADFYKRIGARGGAKSRTGGFYHNRELARIAGAKGGLSSKRGLLKKCHRGHPFNEENTVVKSNGRRYCRICRYKWQKEYNQLRRQDPNYRRGENRAMRDLQQAGI